MKVLAAFVLPVNALPAPNWEISLEQSLIAAVPIFSPQMAPNVDGNSPAASEAWATARTLQAMEDRAALRRFLDPHRWI